MDYGDRSLWERISWCGAVAHRSIDVSRKRSKAKKTWRKKRKKKRKNKRKNKNVPLATANPNMMLCGLARRA